MNTVETIAKLRKQVKLYEEAVELDKRAWDEERQRLKAEAEEAKAEAKRLKESPDALSAAAFDEKAKEAAGTIMKLSDENGYLKAQLERSEKELKALQARDHRKQTERRVWHYLTDDCAMPKMGQDVMVLAVDVKKFGEDLADRKNKGSIYTYISDAKYTGGKTFRLFAAPPGAVPFAWQVRPKVSDARVMNFSLNLLISSLEDVKIFNAVFTDQKRRVMNPQDEAKRLKDVRGRLESAVRKIRANGEKEKEKLARSIKDKANIRESKEPKTV